jgi:translocation and assembly module TamB
VTWRRIIAGTVLLAILAIVGTWWWLLHSTSGAQFLFSRASGLLADALSVDVLSGDIGSGLVLEQLEYTAPAVTVRIGELRAAADLGLYPLTVTLSAVSGRDVEVVLRDSGTTGPPQPPEELLAKLRLPLGLVITDALVTGFRLESPGSEPLGFDRLELAGRWSDSIVIDRFSLEAGTLRAGAAGQIALDAPQRHVLSLQLADEQPTPGELLRYELGVETTGPIDDWRFELAADLESRGLGPLQLNASGNGSLSSIDIGALTAEGPQLAASGDGRVGWADGLSAHAALQVARLELQALVDGWPAGYPVSGYSQLAFTPGRIEVGETEINVAGTDMLARGEGLVDLAAGTVSSGIQWRALRWPIDAREARIASSSGDVVLEGRLDDWSVSGRLALEAAGVDDGNFQVAGSGDRESAEARILEGNVLGGTVAGSISMRWREPLAWTADLDVDNVSPGPVWPDYSGTVSGRVAASGKLAPLAFEARLDDVRGSFEGYALRADGGIEFRDEILTADDLSIRHGTTRLVLDGSMQDTRGLRFVGSADALENYVAGIRGDVALEGTLRTKEGVPVIEGEANSKRLAFGDRELQDTTMALAAVGREQEIRLATRFDDLAIAAALSGRLLSLEAPFPWEGQLDNLTIDAGEQGNLVLEAPAPLEVSTAAVEISSFCLRGPSGARACADAARDQSGAARLVAQLENLPLDTVNRFVDTGYRFEQQLEGDLSLQLAPGGSPTANAALRLSAGRIRTVEQPERSVATGEGTLRLEILDGNLLAAELALPMPGTGVVEGTLRVLDISAMAASDIEGAVHIDVDDIGFVRVLLPTVDRASGRIAADVALGGTVAAPYATGEIALLDGSLGYRPLGLNLDDVRISSTFDADRRFELDGFFRAGEGEGRLSSSGDYGRLAENGIGIELTGRNLKLIDVPDLQAVADADMQVGFRDDSLTIEGLLAIPRARLSPRSLPAARRSESEDVVIVAGGEEETAEAEAKSPLQINGNLEVALGDDVVVDLDVAEAKVAGSVRFQWREQLMPIANGRYTVTGDVEAYGQVLDITEGTIRFSKVPADNPTLRIRAEREIFGNSQVKVAGVLIDGTAKRPRIEPYTEPRTTEERALTLLVTGSDFDMEQGVGAIDFGTYIAPRLFVSYGVGLFDQENVISARYDIGKGFGIKATSGQSESGVDLIYRIER